MTFLFRLRVFIIYSMIFHRRGLIFLFILFAAADLAARMPVVSGGHTEYGGNIHMPVNPYGDGYTMMPEIKDWGFSVSYINELIRNGSGALGLISVTKKINEHYINLLYSPGFRQTFSLEAASGIIAEGRESVSLSSSYEYNEPVSFEYLLDAGKNIRTDVTVKYYSENFSSTGAATYFDTVSSSVSVSTSKSGYKGKIFTISPAIFYRASDHLQLGLTLLNLAEIRTDENAQDYSGYRLSTDRKVSVYAGYAPADLPGVQVSVESDGSFRGAAHYRMSAAGGNITASFSVFHDKYQQPFIAGIMPAMSYSLGSYSVSLSAVKYLSPRSGAGSFDEFSRNGIHSVTNNPYSYDKAVLGFAFALNTLPEKIIEFRGVKMLGDIFPALHEKYFDEPFASGMVINLSGKPVSVKPSGRIAGLNTDLFYSPQVVIAPYDTAEVEFFTVIEPDFKAGKKNKIMQADFFVTAGQYTEQLSAPVLVNGDNSWDGRVWNLRYFVRQDYDSIQSYTRRIISAHKPVLDTVSLQLKNFYIARILYENFCAMMTYVSDPLASADQVQYPAETLRMKGGDCDDLSVAFSAMLESAGIETAFIDYRNDPGKMHVSLMFSTSLRPEEGTLISENDSRYFVRKNLQGTDEIWIPLEMTSMTGFDKSWQTGSELFNSQALDNFGLAKGLVEIVDVY